MTGDLVRPGTGYTPVPLFGSGLEKHVARETNNIVAEVQLAGRRAEGQIAFAGHVMQGLTELNAYKRQLAQDDPSLSLILSEIEMNAARACSRVQRDLFSSSPFRSL